MDNLGYILILIVFFIGYSAIILEYYIKINKSASALFIAVGCWVVYFVSSKYALREDLAQLSHHVGSVSQIIFFLMGAMALVELVDSHKGFRLITDLIHTSSKRVMMWIVCIVAFLLSAILDNLTTTILMVSLLRKLVPDRQERFLLLCLVVVAANAGGAWTPIGDVTTTMLWINGQISSVSVMKALVIPSIVSLLAPLAWYTFRVKGSYKTEKKLKDEKPAPGAKVVLCLGVGGLVFVPIFKALTGLPPFMGVMIALAVVWIYTDLLHHKHENRSHLRIPHVLTRIDTSGVLFFLGILLCVNALEAAGVLQDVANWLNTEVKSLPLIATFIGIISAIVDNVPLVAATMGMYPLEQFPIDSQLWHMIAYAAGTGGSILVIGSSSGVALMGMEKVDFVSYLKKVSLPALFGYLVGMGVYLLLVKLNFLVY
jgi:NhaD family Na+/H+ antiporter